MIYFVFVICSYLEIPASYDEEKLLNYLFGNYTNAVRPALNDADTVNVTLGLSLSQIIDVVRICKVFSVLASFRFDLTIASLKPLAIFLIKVIKDVWQGPKYVFTISKLQHPQSVFSQFQTEYGDVLCKSPYSVQMWENTSQKNSK